MRESKNSKPKVTLVGRANVGKSALFNRLIGERVSLTMDFPGLTRDYIERTLKLSNGSVVLQDCAGFHPINSLDFSDEIMASLDSLLKHTDLALFVIDGKSGVNPTDQMIARKLHKLSKNVILLLNKADPESKVEEELYSREILKLGYGEPLLVSALHGRGFEKLYELMEKKLNDLLLEQRRNLKVNKTMDAELTSEGLELSPSGEMEDDPSLSVLHESAASEDELDTEIDYSGLSGKVAIIGRPNAGKSTLLNSILGYERVITSNIAGTTVDSIDTEVEFEDKTYLFIDTAGVRKKSRVTGIVETISVKSSMEAIRRSDIVLIMIDTTSGLGVQDMKLAALVEKLGKSCLFLVNKWDTIEREDRKKSQKEVLKALEREIPYLSWAETLFVSAKTGEGIKAVFPVIKKILDSRKVKIPTPRLNDMLRTTQMKSPPKPAGKSFSRVLKILYGTQINTNPPKFTFFCNDPDHFHVGYKKFISREIRKLEPYPGTPVKVFFRKRESHTRDILES